MPRYKPAGRVLIKRTDLEEFIRRHQKGDAGAAFTVGNFAAISTPTFQIGRTEAE